MQKKCDKLPFCLIYMFSDVKHNPFRKPEFKHPFSDTCIVSYQLAGEKSCEELHCRCQTDLHAHPAERERKKETEEERK